MHGHLLDARHRAQRGERLLAHAEAAQQMTGRMECDADGQLPGDPARRDLSEKLAELPTARRDAARHLERDRIGVEEHGVLVDEHVGARTGRNDDRSGRRVEHAQRVTRDCACLVVEPGIEGRLAAAGLIERHADLDTEVFEYAHRREGHFGIEIVDQTRVEQLHTSGFVIWDSGFAGRDSCLVTHDAKSIAFDEGSFVRMNSSTVSTGMPAS